MVTLIEAIQSPDNSFIELWKVQGLTQYEFECVVMEYLLQQIPTKIEYNAYCININSNMPVGIGSWKSIDWCEGLLTSFFG